MSGLVIQPDFAKWVDEARAWSIAEIAERRKWPLSGTIERVGPCPACGGDDRFGLNTRKGVFRCRQCCREGGDVIQLVRLVDRCSFVEAVETITGQPIPRGKGGSGLTVEELAAREIERAARVEAEEKAEADYREDERQRCLKIWKRGKLAAGSMVEAYLALRRLSLPPNALLRFAPELRLYAPKRKGEAHAQLVHTGPAMLAAVRRPDGEFGGVHMTWIDLAAPNGKVLVPDPKTGEFVAAKKVRGSQRGGRIELLRHRAPRRLLIGEGIETTVSYLDDEREAGRDLSACAAWASINLDNLGGPAADKVRHPSAKDLGGRPVRIAGPTPEGYGIPIPDSVEEIVILGDGDSDPFLTSTTHARASARWARPGREIRVAMAPPDTDFNSLRMSRPL